MKKLDEKDDRPMMICLLGPTASGKSALAMQLAAEFPCELISVDSAQVYRGMDIGTAKPSLEERVQVRHHLLDICDPSHIYSVNEFYRDAQQCIAEIQQRGKIPLLVGGTCLYFHALRVGLAELPSADEQLRARLNAEAQQLGWPILHQRLAQYDAITAARLHPNDGQRILRAIEVYEITGQPLSYWHAQQQDLTDHDRTLWLGLMPASRADLHQRIATRFLQMVEAGFDEEVRALMQRGDLHIDLPSMRSVGYRQWWAYLQGELTCEQAIERAIIATRQLAKRQLTWLRRWPGLTLLPSDDRLIKLSVIEQVRKFIEKT
jgi:tRNA dimethylallyltransferase